MKQALLRHRDQLEGELPLLHQQDEAFSRSVAQKIVQEAVQVDADHDQLLATAQHANLELRRDIPLAAPQQVLQIEGGGAGGV